MQTTTTRLISRRMTTTLTTLVIAVLTLIGPAQAFAKDYLIEVIVLQNRRGGGTAGAPALYLPRIKNAFGLSGEKAKEAGFELVETDLALLEEAEKIKASGGYRLLHHFAWRQPGLDDTQARAVRVNVGQGFKLHIPRDFKQYDYFIPATATAAIDGSSRELTSTTVSGTLKVRLGRFLHLDTLLAYTDTDSGITYRMQHSRKMRSRELHYIDNPKFGLLVRIRPIEE